MSLLKTTDLGISFGGLRAVDNVNIEIKKGELILYIHHHIIIHIFQT